MNIRNKIFLGLILIGLTLFIFTSFAVQTIVVGNVQKIEKTNNLIILDGINEDLEVQADELLLSCADYSVWDSTYDFANDENPSYIGRDFTEASFNNIDFDFFLVLDKNGEKYYVETTVEDDWKNAAVEQIVDSGEFIPDNEGWNKTGYTIISGKPVLFVANPILKSDYSGPIAGTLVWGRIMDDVRVSSFIPASVNNMELTLTSVEPGENIVGYNLSNLSDRQALGVSLLKSSFTNFSQIQVNLLFQRTIYIETIATSHFFLTLFALIDAFLITTCMWVLETRLIKQFKDINLQVSKLDINKTNSPIVYDKMNEISPIINSINMLLCEIETYKKRLIESERLAAIGQTASMVGHDLRNPLQTITLTSYLLRKALSEEVKVISLQDYNKMMNLLDTADSQIIYMDKIVSDIQMFTGTREPRKEKYDLLRIAREVLETLKTPPNIHVVVESNSNLPQVEVDVYMLRRVFSNLILNAIQAMPDGGLVRVYSEELDDSVLVSVQDNGSGISESVMGNLFKPFYTTKAKGTGLGLAASRRIIEAHGGRIDVESKVRMGSRFYFSLPLRMEVPDQVY